MIGVAMYTTVITLHNQGKSLREISRLSGHSRNTVSRILEGYKSTGKEEPNFYNRQNKSSIYHEEILKYLERGLSVRRIYEELQRVGHKASYSSVNRYVCKLKISNDICIRFHTDPGYEAQVDFGDVGKQYPGQKRKGYVFNMRLSYSRLDYYEIVYDQKVETFINCHINAFRYFGGVPGVVRIDNLKAAILDANFYEPLYQTLYKSFANYYNFAPQPCRVRQPQEKGKVEAGIKYIKNNFLAGRSFKNREELESELKSWLEEYCNNRIHGTTRQKPRSLFEEAERSTLRALPVEDFVISNWCKRKVQRDCHIMVGYNYYSVPYEYVNQEVEVQTGDKLISVYVNGKQVALHTKEKEKGKFITNRSHYPKYKVYYPESQEYLDLYKQKMSIIGSEAAKYFSFIITAQPENWYRTIRGIINLRNSYSDEDINLACKRAKYYSVTQYRKIRSILNSGCYKIPLNDESVSYEVKNEIMQ